MKMERESNIDKKRKFDRLREHVVNHTHFHVPEDLRDWIIEFINRNTKEFYDSETRLWRARKIEPSDYEKLRIERDYQRMCYEDEQGNWIGDPYRGLPDDKRPDKTGFYGYDAKDSGMPPKDMRIGSRCAPTGIPVMYTAENRYTAIVECGPDLDGYVSLAEVKVLIPCKLLNIERTEGDQLADLLVNEFAGVFGSAISSYIMSQWVSMLALYCNCDGVRYPSSLHGGKFNVALFGKGSYSDPYSGREDIFKWLYEIVGSEVIRINNVEIMAERYLCKDDTETPEIMCSGPLVEKFWRETVVDKQDQAIKDYFNSFDLP